MTPEAAEAARHYVRRLHELAARLAEPREWTAEDWEIVGARAILLRALAAEQGRPMSWPVDKMEGSKS